MSNGPLLKPQLREWLIARFATIPNLSRVVLFGSRARGDADERSDIDLAIKADGTLLSMARVSGITDEAPTLLLFDVVDLDHVPELLRREIEQEGIVIYERAA
jgi:uncharacterized protein